MSNFPTDRYKYYTYTDKETKAIVVVAASTYCGKAVKGYAKCNPADTFDLEKGKTLAAARCAQKIANRRNKRAAAKLREAKENLNKAYEYYSKMSQYANDAWFEAQNAIVNTTEVYKTM